MTRPGRLPRYNLSLMHPHGQSWLDQQGQVRRIYLGRKHFKQRLRPLFNFFPLHQLVVNFKRRFVRQRYHHQKARRPNQKNKVISVRRPPLKLTRKG